MFSKTPTWLIAILLFIIITLLYLGFSWLSLQFSSQQKPQVIPVLARIEIAEQRIYLEVPQSSEQQAKGLMYRTIVPRNRGILFEFDPPQVVEFSMQNLLVPVDTIFLKNREIQQIQVAVPACNADCPTYSSKVAVDQMIQLQAQRTLELNLNKGDRLQIDFLDPDTKIFHSKELGVPEVRIPHELIRRSEILTNYVEGWSQKSAIGNEEEINGCLVEGNMIYSPDS